MIAVVAALTVLVAAIGLAALVAEERTERASERISGRWSPALVALERLQRAFLDEETAVRGFVLTGQDPFIDPYRAAPALIAAQEAVLRPALAGDPAASGQLAAVLDAHRQWSDSATVRLVAPTLAGQAAEARAFAATGTGKRLFDALRARVDELRMTLERLVTAEAARIEAVRATTSRLRAVAIAAAVTCALLTLVGVRRAVTRPLATPVDAVSALGAGALDRDVPVTGPRSSAPWRARSSGCAPD